MRHDFYYPSRDGKTKIHAAAWIPAGQPRAVLQICHGMCEHIGRYAAFAEFLEAHGIAVVGNDHLGHGTSVTDPSQRGYFADENGNLILLKDMHTLRTLTEKRLPGIPYLILGFSMGSFLTRQYIARCGEGLAGAVIMGTGTYTNAALRSGMIVCRRLAAAKGWHSHSNVVQKRSIGNNNKRIVNVRTKLDWMSKDTAFVDDFIHDPLCLFPFTVNAYFNMFTSIEDAQAPEVISMIPRKLPMLLISGQEDPVGNYGKGVETAFRHYRAAEPERDLTMKLYPEDRHVILNETDREQIYADLLDWMEQHIGA